MSSPPPDSPTPPSPADRQVGYVRGSGVELDRRKAARVVAVLGIVLLAALTIGFTVAGIAKVQRNDRLAHHGVPVTVTVTSCVAVASGTGATVTGYLCKGSFTLDGHRHDETIGGTTTPHPVGQRLPAVADPSDPSVMATATSVAAIPTAWEAFVIPAAALLLLLILIAVLLWRRRSRAGRV